MDALEAVLDLVRERDDLATQIEEYESWFESFIGKDVTLSVVSKKKTRFVDCTVTEFIEGEGWELTCTETDETYTATFQDFAEGKLILRQ